MANSFGLKDVSSKDTGKGSKLKTGNLRRNYKMAEKKKKAVKKKCKGGYKLNDKGVCVQTKVSKGAETVGRTIAGVLTWGGSEALIRSQKKKK